jgi:hypothetical protein
MGEADELIDQFLRSKPRPPSIGAGTRVEDAERMRAEYDRAHRVWYDKLQRITAKFGIGIGSVLPSNCSINSDDKLVRPHGRSFTVKGE